jgi:hypothetical protein
MVVLAMAAAAALVPVLVPVMVTGCSDATGELKGGQSLVVDPCPADAGNTWTDLYQCYFGPSGRASCAGMSDCHTSSSNTIGAGGFFFVCGPTKDTCWDGFTSFLVDGDAGPMRTVGAGNTLQYLRAPGSKVPIMPCNVTGQGNGVPTCNLLGLAGNAYTFTQDDLNRINAWIMNGAQDN